MRSRFRLQASLLLAVLLVLGLNSPVAAADVTVFAAASLKEAMDEQAQGIRNKHG